ncbi:unnamed protein product [Chondrus crispus]|uniref:Uncharacterized protein n=1 Tax=Chondrus crispus TaxID=2769 RepID=R7Q687_CHOCR|nr:unnamed protein product [Chondrus crispus]CDF32906.1 unnamed protein product [Chondrus crispus]|eukprot:XP_005712707.1 unnamed protein product [Chondrus crispus]
MTTGTCGHGFFNCSGSQLLWVLCTWRPKTLFAPAAALHSSSLSRCPQLLPPTHLAMSTASKQCDLKTVRHLLPSQQQSAENSEEKERFCA